MPGPPEPGVFAVDSVAREGGTDAAPVFRIAATVPATGETRLFVEGPADWSPYEPVLVSRDGDRVVYDAKFSRTGAKTPIAGASIPRDHRRRRPGHRADDHPRLAAAAALSPSPE